MKILVVEDNQKLARFLRRALSEEGHVVDVVGEGGHAQERLAALAYELVILDWMLPDKDGLEVCRELRAQGAAAPILMLTARASVDERIAGLNAGADDYLAKPFDLGELLARVRALGRRGPANVTVELGPLRLDALSRVIYLDGAALGLTPREYAVLEQLIRARGDAVTKTEFLDKVWGLAFDPGSNIVEVHVKKVRDKLGARAQLIRTLRGVGYRLDVDAASEAPG
ncbi:MAG: response regulator transcription factor [Nannocystaceae bacterium]